MKVSGELVSLAGLNTRLAALGISGAVVAVPDQRRGNELVLVVEGGTAGAFDRFNSTLPLVEQVSRVIAMAELPRTDLGKLDIAAISKQVRDA